eukprot:scaffold348074_cov30-Prasinocladus_malaysianus.AAC.2
MNLDVVNPTFPYTLILLPAYCPGYEYKTMCRGNVEQYFAGCHRAPPVCRLPPRAVPARAWDTHVAVLVRAW